MAAMATTSVTIADISDGLDGTGISSTKIEYQAGSSGTSAPTGTWSTSVPSTSASAPYLWTRVTYNYSDGRNPEYVYSVGSTPEGIEIGGRNLLLGSANPVKNFSWVSSNGSSTKTEEDMLGVKGVLLDVITPSTDWQFCDYNFGASRMKLIKPDTYYTLSFDVYPSVDGSVMFSIRDSNATNAVTTNSEWKNIVANQWNHISLTVKTFSTITISYQIIYIHGINSVGTYKICNFKLEEGNKATDWTPAPEDVNEAINKVDVKTEQLDDKLHWMVKSGTSATDFTLTDRVASLLSTEFNIDALTTFKNSAENGTSTVINGGAIKAKTIKAESIDVDSIFAEHISAKGTITGGSFIGSTFEGATGSFTGEITATSGRIGFMDVTSTDISLNKGDIYGEFTLSSDKSIEISDIRKDGSANIFNLSFDEWTFEKRENYITDRYKCRASAKAISFEDRGSDGKHYEATFVRADKIITPEVTVNGYSTKNTILNHVRVYELTVGNVTINSSSPWSMSLASTINSLCETTSGFYGACLKMCWPHSTWAFACTLLVNGTNVYIATTTTQVYDVRILIFYNPYL